jgi:hypothetical protein
VKTLQTLLLFIVAVAVGNARAQELTPRAYWPAPEGTRVATIGFVHTSGDTVPDASLPVTGLDSKINTGFLGYRQTIDLFGRTTNLIFEVPFSNGETTAIRPDFTKVKREYDGLGDIAATISVNFIGAPTMDRAGFAELRAKPRPLLGGSIKIVAPTGDYDNDRIINVGANRWAARAELGFMAVMTPMWLLELEAGAWFFQDNDDFLGKKREQEYIKSVEAHLVRRFSPGFWMSLDGTFYRGGRSTFDGRRLNDLQRDSKLGATLVFPFASKHAVRVSYATGSANDSKENFDIYAISYQRLF